MILRGNSTETPYNIQDGEFCFTFCRGMRVIGRVGEWVGGWVSLPKYCYFSPLKNNCISVVSHISYELECVVNFHNVHCRALLRIPTWMSLYLTHLGQGLCWCRTINATNNPNNNNNKYKSVLNVMNERNIVVKCTDVNYIPVNRTL